jgi:hypothetical protein
LEQGDGMSDDPDNYKERKLEEKITMDSETPFTDDDLWDALRTNMTEQEMNMRCVIGELDDYRMTNNYPDDMVTGLELQLQHQLDITSDELNFANEYIDRLRLWIGEVEWADFFDANADLFNDEEE